MKRVFEGRFVLVDAVQTDRERAAEVVRIKAGPFSVAFLIYDPESKAVIFVEQERPAMRRKENPKGIIDEVPAGRADRKESIAALVAREASEEVGASISEDQVVLLNGGQPLAVSPGILDELMYLAYVELQPGQLEPNRVFGVAEEGERIKRMLVPIGELAVRKYQDLKTFALVHWFLHRQETEFLQQFQESTSG